MVSKKQCGIKKKLSLGISGSPKNDDDNKENVLPFYQLKPESIPVYLPKSLPMSHADDHNDNLLRQNYLGDNTKQNHGEIETSLISENLIMLDSEDSEEEMKGPTRSRVLFARDPYVEQFEGDHLVFVAAGPDPFDVITNAVMAIENHLQTFYHCEKKKISNILNRFGWCRWDDFYMEVTAEEVTQGDFLSSEDFDPALIPEKTIPNLDDKKREDWDELYTQCLAEDTLPECGVLAEKGL
ncbi:hypothetical protein GIB67_016836 [Kingdonia uniflora]|uniref:Uncharacterized protein n=1 Tax=Kingdonia uniflora TaxID=39325 RepID=A0A7J7LQD8_9MAGN|nr:hypothetical protein GIB67_016836 [Kingdonia uniflora]